MPFLLSSARRWGTNTAEFREIAIALRNTSLGYLVLARKDPARFEAVLFELAKLVYLEQKGITDVLKDIRTGFGVTKDELRQAVRKPVSLKKKQAVILLTQLAASETSGEVLEKATLEHIAPQKNRPSEYPQEIEQYVWHLGNLILLEKELNRRAGSKPFGEKLEIYKESQIPMAKKIAEEYQEWNEKSIITRAEDMIEKLAQHIKFT
jgi:hypothetical protein